MPAYGTLTLPPALYAGDQYSVFNAETVLINQNSERVAVSVNPDGSIRPVSVEIKFSAAPGAFEIDVMESDTDVLANYVAAAVGSITAVNATNAARLDFVNLKSKFLMLFVKTAPANNPVACTAKITA